MLFMNLSFSIINQSFNHSFNQSIKEMNKIFVTKYIYLFDNMSAVSVKFDCIVNMAQVNVSAVPCFPMDPEYVWHKKWSYTTI